MDNKKYNTDGVVLGAKQKNIYKFAIYKKKNNNNK